jgi:hypothetical protein
MMQRDIDALLHAIEMQPLALQMARGMSCTNISQPRAGHNINTHATCAKLLALPKLMVALLGNARVTDEKRQTRQLAPVASAHAPPHPRPSQFHTVIQHRTVAMHTLVPASCASLLQPLSSPREYCRCSHRATRVYLHRSCSLSPRRQRQVFCLVPACASAAAGIVIDIGSTGI